MSREYNLYLRDILEAIGRIERYTRGMGYEEFLADDLVQDGVNRNSRLRSGRCLMTRLPDRPSTVVRRLIPACPADVARHDRMVALVEQMLDQNKRLAAGGGSCSSPSAGHLHQRRSPGKTLQRTEEGIAGIRVGHLIRYRGSNTGSDQESRSALQKTDTE